MLHATWRRILRSKGRLVLTMLAVAVGVAFLTGSLVLADSTRTALDDSYAQVYAGADVIVRGPEPAGDSPLPGGGAPLPEGFLDLVADAPGVAAVEGRVSSAAQLTAPGDEQGEPAIAIALPDDPARSAIELRSGRLPRSPDEVALDAAVAAALGLAPGDRVRVLLPDGEVDARVAGTVGFGRLDGLAGGARVLFDEATAAGLFGGTGYAELLVRARPEMPAAQLAEELSATLGQDAVVLSAAEAARRDAAAASRQTALVSRIVLAVAVVALGIGAFLVANTFRMLVGQRARELALLRAIGASRRQVGASVLAEAAITGGIGSLLGVALGLGAGALLVATSAGLVPGLPPLAPTVTPTALLAGPVVGVGVAVLAGRGAARRALAVPPVAALRQESAPDPGPSRRRLVAGAVVVAAAAAAVLLGVRTGTAQLLVGGAVGLIIGSGLLLPFLTGPVLRAVSAPAGRISITGALARQQALAAPRRTAATAAALAVTLALVSFLLVFNASLGAGAPELLTGRQHAEYTIRSSARQGLHDALFPLAERLDALPEVATARVVTYGEARITDPSGDDPRPRTAALHLVDPAAAGELFDVRSSDGDLAALGAGEVAVRADVAAANGWERGERLAAELPDGTSEELLIAVLFDGAVSTDWIAAPQTGEAHQLAAYREAFVRLAEGVSVEEARPALEPIVEEVPAAVLLSRDDLVEEMAAANETSLGLLTALFALSLAVGVLGVVNTLTLAVVERVRELGLLRAVGATRGQVRSIIRWEALLVSTLGAVVGGTLGVALAFIATHALPGQSLPFTVPGVHLGAAFLATAALGTAASLVPAFRASRIDVLRALQAP